MLRPAFARPVILAASVLALPAHAASEMPAYRAAEPGAPALTAESLPAGDRFWPYQVALTSAWKPEGRETPLPAGTLAVLVRVESAERLRMDFGRDGRFEVPVAATDVLERANEIRAGRLEKRIPNLVRAIGPRLVDSESERIQPLDFDLVFEPEAFLLVFVDPEAAEFEAIVRELSPLRERRGLMTVLVPEGVNPDPLLRARLRALGWKVPFLMDHYAEGYTRALRGEGRPLPAVMLLTRNGRPLFDEGWRAGVGAALEAALPSPTDASHAAR